MLLHEVIGGEEILNWQERERCEEKETMSLGNSF